MVHICNECKYNDVCKEKFKEKTGMLCNNKYFRKEVEKDFIENKKQLNN